MSRQSLYTAENYNEDALALGNGAVRFSALSKSVVILIAINIKLLPNGG